MAMVAVVPIFMGAGAAILPTVLGVLASVGAVLMKPRELAGMIRRRPGAAAGWAAGLAAAIAGVTWGVSAVKAKSVAHPAVQRTDWARIAQAILARQAAGSGDLSIPPTATQAAQRAGPVVLGGDYRRGGFAGGPSPGSAQSPLKALWSYSPDETMFLATPAVAGNRVYIAGCVAGLGEYNGLLTCVDADTGKPLWAIDEAKRADGKTRPLKAFFSSPALSADGKRLIIGQGLHADHDCGLLCVDAQTGKQLWVVGTSLHIESSPAIGIIGGQEVAVVGAGAIEGADGKPTGNPGEVLAVRIADGKELWRAPVNDPESTPAIDDAGNVYIGSGFNGAAVVALSGAEGRPLWRAETGLPMMGPITVDGELVIAGGGNSDVVHSAANARGIVVALDRKTGRVVWKTDFADAVLGGIAARDGTLICPVRTGEVVALSEKDGRELWRSRVSGSAAVVAGCAFTGTKVYAVSNDGFLAVLAGADGRLLQKVFLNGQGKAGTGLSVSDPQVVGGRVIVGSETGGVQAFVGGAS
jgi:outer membrane protein assembly factor BamB